MKGEIQQTINRFNEYQRLTAILVSFPPTPFKRHPLIGSDDELMLELVPSL